MTNHSKTLNKKLVLKGLIIGLIVSALSFIVTLVPCTKETGLGLCKLPSPISDLPETAQRFYGISNNPITGLILQTFIPIIIVMVIPLILKKKPQKIIDFTRK